MLYDVDSGAVLVVSKEGDGEVYSTPPRVFARSSATLCRIAPAPSDAPDASWLPANGSVVVRTYLRAFVYRFPLVEARARVHVAALAAGGVDVARTGEARRRLGGHRGSGLAGLGGAASEAASRPRLHRAVGVPPGAFAEPGPFVGPASADQSDSPWHVGRRPGDGRPAERDATSGDRAGLGRRCPRRRCRRLSRSSSSPDVAGGSPSGFSMLG